MEFADYLQTLRRDEPGLAAEIAHFHNLENILDWMQARSLSLATIEVVQQDEYNHDMVIPLDASGRHLVFGMT